MRHNTSNDNAHKPHTITDNEHEEETDTQRTTTRLRKKTDQLQRTAVTHEASNKSGQKTDAITEKQHEHSCGQLETSDTSDTMTHQARMQKQRMQLRGRHQLNNDVEVRSARTEVKSNTSNENAEDTSAIMDNENETNNHRKQRKHLLWVTADLPPALQSQQTKR